MQALSIRNLSSLKTQVKFPKTLTTATVAALATLAFVMLVSALPALAQVNGAIYTTTSTGTTVNGNLYDAKTGVYLNGGPQNSKDAGLVPDGSYYFQITDPSGAVLLSADDISCRQIVVTNGRIVGVPAKTPTACKSGFHLLGTYNASNGETPIQLCPPTSSSRTDNLNAGTYFDAKNWCDSTPNPGGEYKAWVTPVSSYNNCAKSNANVQFGFCDSDSKTDNFKVKGSNSAYITVCKYNDLDGNGTQGASEPLIPGWPISATGVDTLSGPLGTVNAQTDANGCISFSVSDFTTAKGKVTITEGSLTGSWHETAPVVGTYTVPDGIIPAHNGTVTVAVSNAGAPPNTQSLTVAAGENLTLTNFGNTCMDSSCGGNSVELTVTTDANPSLTRTYTWEIAKSVDNTTVNSVGGGKSSPANYTVTVTHDQGTDSGWQVTGTIKISNPSWVDLGGVDVADTVSNGGTCTVTNGSAIIIPAKSEVDVPFSCTYSSLPGNGTDTAAVTWNSGSTTSGKATGTAAVNFGSPAVTVRDGGVTVADKLDNTTPVTLGTPSYSDPSPIKYTYFHTFTDPAGTCTSHTNNATFKTNTTGTTGSASATVQDCQVNPPSATCVVINAVLGVAITPVTMAASGGTGTGYTFSATGLPAGLTMASNGTITGTPTVSGTFSYTVTVRDSGGNTGTVTCSVTVNPASQSSTVTLAFSNTVWTYPGEANITACVLPANHPSATGSMRILDGGTVLTTLAVQPGGCANWYITPGLNAGTHTFTASYAGDNNYPAGTSAPATITVAKAPMTMEASCWNPSIPYGINYQCNANTDSGPKSGYMTYTYDNGAPVVLPLDSNGATAFIISTPSVGTHTVVIAYPTQGNYVGQTLPANTFTVRPAPVAVTLTPSAFSTTAGTQVSFTAKVTSGTTSVPNATGSVSFLNGSALLATVPVNASGLAVYSTSLNAGNNVITATYAGAANYGSGSATATIAVSQASQTITFTGLPATATYSAGLSYALTATASSSLPVSYVVTGPATTAGSILNITVAGTVTVTASQAGNTNYIAAKPVKLTISVGNPPLPSATISVQFASTTLVYPGATNITACVTAATKKAATGTVQILDGGNVLTTQTLQGNGCAYWSITPGLNAGSHVFTTSYSGDSKNAAGVSTPTTITVNPVPVTMSLSAAGGSTPYGVAFKRTVTVSSNAGSPLGSITYSLDGGTPISVALASGNALVNIALPSAGTHQVVIGYAQQTNYAAAASQTLSFTVTPAVSSVTLASSASSAKSGTNVSFTAAVTSTSAGAPNASGSVTFKDGSTVLATVAVNSTGNASYSITGLAVGLHTITATYAGSSNYATASTTTKVYITM